jgi:hypothetical protein
VIWFVFLVMCLTAYRATRLLIKDTFPPVLWLRDTLAGGWRPLTEQEQREPVQVRTWHAQEVHGVMNRWVERRAWSPDWLAELITCPWCASAYVSGGLTAAVDVLYGVPVPWLVGPAVWAVAALLASREWA